jgi:gluconokinase
VGLDQETAMYLIVMGVAGSGKTTIGKGLAERLGCRFYDGDDFHPPANVAKMAAGIPLTNKDRAAWLGALAALIQRDVRRGECGVLACSALKERYRKVLRVDASKVKFVYLKGSYDLILSRMQNRTNHYMKPTMLQSQFEALEEPSDALIVDIAKTPGEICDEILSRILPASFS